MYDAQKGILNSVKLSTQKADETRLKDPWAPVNPSCFVCTHHDKNHRLLFKTWIFSFFSSSTGLFQSVHKIIGCLLNEQRDIIVYSAIQQMATDFPAISYLTPALRPQISSQVYHHHRDTGKMSSTIFVSTTSLWKKGEELLISHLGNWGVKRARLGWLWSSNLSYSKENEKWCQVTTTGWAVLKWFSCFQTTPAMPKQDSATDLGWGQPWMNKVPPTRSQRPSKCSWTPLQEKRLLSNAPNQAARCSEDGIKE